MLNPDPIRAAARSQKRKERLGSEAACALCGANDPALLDAIQGHHVANRVNDPGLTVVLCANCHRQQTETNEALGIPSRYVDEPWPLERLAAILAGVAAFLHQVADRLRQWAEWLAALQKSLITNGIDLATVLPGWTPQAPWSNS